LILRSAVLRARSARRQPLTPRRRARSRRRSSANRSGRPSPISTIRPEPHVPGRSNDDHGTQPDGMTALVELTKHALSGREQHDVAFQTRRVHDAALHVHRTSWTRRDGPPSPTQAGSRSPRS
jgi:hypothetical protein